jgi:hypothetical protein
MLAEIIWFAHFEQLGLSTLNEPFELESYALGRQLRPGWGMGKLAVIRA